MTAHTAAVRALPTTGRGNEATLVRYTGASAPRARAAQAAPDAIDLPAGLPGTVMAFKGDGAPPHVILHGPTGVTVDTGAGNAPVHTPGVVALKDPSTGITEVVLAKPAGGRWTVAVAPDSSRLVEALQADGVKAPKITGRVLGKAPRQRLAYTVAGLAEGAHVDFAEVGAATGSLIGRTTRNGSGTLPFTPGEGAAGKRDVQAIVTGADGYVNARTKLGTYRAPGPPRPATPRKLTVKRSGTSLILSWPRDPRAKTTQVDLRTSSGLNVTRIVKRPTLKLRAPAAGTTLKLTLTATTRTGVVGSTARFTRRVPAATKHHKKAARRR
jgi:hypothetical protein